MSPFRVDTILRHANVVTIDPTRPRTDRLAVHHGRIVAIGHDVDGLEAREVVDLDGATVVPGFNDAHNHMLVHGLRLSEVSLHSPPLRSVAELCTKLREAAAAVPAGGWLLATGYDQNKLKERRHPTRLELDAAAPGRRVWVMHVSGHMSTVNSMVLDDIGWPDVEVPDGGVVERDADGHPTGLLQEQAQALVKDLRWPTPVDELVDALDRASRQYLAEGVTSAQEAGVGGGLVRPSALDVAAFHRARGEGRLHVRCTLMVANEALHEVPLPEGVSAATHLDTGIGSGFGDDWLRIGATKVFADGSLIGRTCAMDEDFADDRGNRGYFQMDEAELHRRILHAHRAGWQVATHAIGDRAIRSVLDAYEAALTEQPRPDHRHRIEHCAVVPPDLVDRIARLGVIPVPQGRFITELGDGMIAALGRDRVPWTYRQRSLIEAGIELPGSSDRPVVDGRPLAGIHDMVNQVTADGQPFSPGERVTPEQALRAWTLGSAHAAFDEKTKGSIEVGKLADLVVLSHDPTAIAPNGIRDIEVVATMVDGAWRHGEV